MRLKARKYQQPELLLQAEDIAQIVMASPQLPPHSRSKESRNPD